MKKVIAIVFLALMVFSLSACNGSNTDKDIAKTYSIGDELAQKQPTPTDFDYSLERYNLVRRAYWVNGQRDKAASVPCPISDVPLGYIVLFDYGTVVGRFTVDGKISSLNSFLTPDGALVYSYPIDRRSNPNESGVVGSSGQSYTAEMPDIDGSYGANDNGIFFFTPDGKYLEWKGNYLYSDIPFEIENPILKIEGGN